MLVYSSFVMRGLTYFIFLLVAAFSLPFMAYAAEGEDASASESLDFFYSPTCPHCQAEQVFLDELALEYPDLSITRFNITEGESQAALEALLLQHPGAERYRGLVPLTFYKEQYFVGFDEGVAERIRSAILGEEPTSRVSFTLPIVGTLSAEALSLPLLAVVLGFLDGFNVCSLGALMLILGMVLTLGSRRLVLLFGGIFIVITALTYGVLIVLWHRLFLLVGPYVGALEMVIGVLALLGGVYLVREYLKQRSQGLVCDSSSGRVVTRLTKSVEAALARGGILPLSGAIALFALALAVMEFPCSAAIPVTFAGMLAAEGVSGALSLGYISLFILFYLLDEVLIFLGAVYAMKLFSTSQRLVSYATLLSGVILVLFGLYYTFGGALLSRPSYTGASTDVNEVGSVCKQDEGSETCEVDVAAAPFAE